MPDATFTRVFGHVEIDRIRTAGRLLRPTPLDSFEGPDARAVLAEVEVLVTGWEAPVIDASVLDRAPRLRAVVHAAGSVKHHVAPDCWRRGIIVTSAADANAKPVAEYTVAMILLAGKNVLQVAQALRRRRAAFAPDDLFPRMGNYGKRIGIIGASTIGRDVIQLLRPYDVQVVVHDPFLSPSEADGLEVELADLPELLATCDVVSLHAPSLPETRHLLDECFDAVHVRPLRIRFEQADRERRRHQWKRLGTVLSNQSEQLGHVGAGCKHQLRPTEDRRLDGQRDASVVHDGQRVEHCCVRGVTKGLRPRAGVVGVFLMKPRRDLWQTRRPAGQLEDRDRLRIDRRKRKILGLSAVTGVQHLVVAGHSIDRTPNSDDRLDGTLVEQRARSAPLDRS